MLRSSLIAAVAVLAVATTTMAAQKKAPTEWANGQIERFDSTSKTLVVKQGEHELSFALAPDVTVMLGKKSMKESDLAANVGHKVKVEYQMSPGAKRTATRVEIAEAATHGKSKEPTKR